MSSMPKRRSARLLRKPSGSDLLAPVASPKQLQQLQQRIPSGSTECSLQLSAAVEARLIEERVEDCGGVRQRLFKCHHRYSRESESMSLHETNYETWFGFSSLLRWQKSPLSPKRSNRTLRDSQHLNTCCVVVNSPTTTTPTATATTTTKMSTSETMSDQRVEDVAIITQPRRRRSSEAEKSRKKRRRTTNLERRQQTTSSKTMSFKLVKNVQTLSLIAIVLMCCLLVVKCKPNNSPSSSSSSSSMSSSLEQEQRQQQQQQNNIDKQLLRKAATQFDESTRTSGAQQVAAVSNDALSTNIVAASSTPNGNSNAPFQCPEQFGYYTDTRDCTRYYVCVFGEVMHESCTGGLRFSRELQTCDWPRNVECIQTSGGHSSNDSTSSTTTASAPSSSSSTTTTSTSSMANTTPSTPITTTSSTAATTTTMTTSPQSAPTTTLTPKHHSHHHNQHLHPHLHPHSHHSNHNSNQQQDKHRSSQMKGANLVSFADEGTDPQQPSFDEAVSPVITADGTIHLHDGSGGTFSLPANHNRGSGNGPDGTGSSFNPNQSPGGDQAILEADSPLRGQNSNNQVPFAHQNVNIFVKPLTKQQLQLQRRQNQQQQQQQQQVPRSREVGLKPLLQLANSPARASNQQRPKEMLPGNDHRSQSMPSSSSSSGPESSLLDDVAIVDDASAAFSGDESAGEQPNDSNGNSDNSAGDAGSIGLQADQDLNEDTGQPEEATSKGPTLSNGLGGSGSAAYIPPVMAVPNTQLNGGNEMAAGGLRATTSTLNLNENESETTLMDNGARGNSNGIGKEASTSSRSQSATTSQLLSIDNRQIVDPSRSSFKPVIPSSSLKPSSLQVDSSTSSLINSNSNGNSNGSNNNNAASGNRLMAGNQQRNQFFSSHPSASVGGGFNPRATTNPKPVTLLPANAAANSNNNGQQNNRQSRMSSQFQAQSRPSLLQAQTNGNSNSNNNNNNNNVVGRQFFPLTTNDRLIITDNVNFNDSSKLIRLSPQQQLHQLSSQQQLANNLFEPSSASQAHQFQHLPHAGVSPQRSQLNGNVGPTSGLFSPSLSSSQQQQQQQQQHSSSQFAFASSSGGGQQVNPQLHHNNGNGNNNNAHLFHNEHRFSVLDNGNSAADSSSSSQQLQHQLQLQQQQQRRPRPPKRQQIPTGLSGSGSPVAQDSSSGSGRSSANSAHQPIVAPTIVNFQPDGSTHSPPVPGTLVAATLPPVILSKQQVQGHSNANSNLHSLSHSSHGQQHSHHNHHHNHQHNQHLHRNPHSTTTTTATTPAATATDSELTDDELASIQEQPMTSTLGDSSSLPVNTQPLLTTSSTPTTASSDSSQEQPENGNDPSVSTGNGADFSSSSGQSMQPIAPVSPASIATATASTSTSGGGSTTLSDQNDPQVGAANRYLNSAIDALEAGQPFGAVDYDFDILNGSGANSNNTDRRNPSPAAIPLPPTSSSTMNPNSLSSSSSTASINPIANANNRQRKKQQLSANANDQQHDSASDGGINLTNSGQIGINTRAQQQLNSGATNDNNNNASPAVLPSTTTTTSGRSRVLGAANNRLQTSTLNGRLQQQQQQQLRQQVAATNGNGNNNNNNQLDSFNSAANNNQQQASLSSTSSTQQQAASAQQVNNNSNNQQQAPTKKPRPTNKKITVNHEQALANNRASNEPAKRPEALFATPNVLQTATKCDNRVCRLPDCKCGDTLTPAGLDPKVIPQIVLLTFDDAVNDLNWEIYEELFTGRTNPNGCPILATFYVSHEWTDYGQVQTLYSRGHEIASHSITHSFGEKFSKSQWFKEVNGQREILNMYGGVKLGDVRGMRAPFLQIGGNKMFEMLYDANFTYDSSMPIFENLPPLWPYTLDYQLAHECMITPCPTKSFPGVWEVGMTMWVDLRGGRCSMGDACSNPPDEDGVYEMLMKNFNRHYKSNRAPFGLFYHSAWFNTVHHRRGFLRFLNTVNSYSDVFFVTNWQMIQWMRQPTPISEINSFEPWQCPAKNDRPPPCYHPSVCNVKSEHGTRFMKTCQPCPANHQYPWVGSTGFNKSKQTSSGSGK